MPFTVTTRTSKLQHFVWASFNPAKQTFRAYGNRSRTYGLRAVGDGEGSWICTYSMKEARPKRKAWRCSIQSICIHPVITNPRNPTTVSSCNKYTFFASA